MVTATTTADNKTSTKSVPDDATKINVGDDDWEKKIQRAYLPSLSFLHSLLLLLRRRSTRAKMKTNRGVALRATTFSWETCLFGWRMQDPSPLSVNAKAIEFRVRIIIYLLFVDFARGLFSKVVYQGTIAPGDQVMIIV